ncbi:MAG: hypothetical protein IJ829_01985, partial [Kiritimatiellae bacterium]|nr:hypothetical protein [Kiritimatiellia bacterium]
MSASRAFAALAAVVLSAVLPVRAAVYAPGLAQAKFKTNQSDKTSDILSSSTLTYAAGPVLANTTGSATDLGGASWAWENNTTFGYLGEMRVEAGTTYTFGKSVDDWTYIVVNGTTLIDNGTHDAFISASYTATETGWVPVEIRVGNGQGGAGVSSGALWGVGYNTVGDTSWEHFMAGTDGWAALLDPGDGTLLRAAYSSTDLMTVSSVAIDGADLVVTVSFAGLAAAGTFTAFYGAGDGEAIPGDWDHAVVLATPDAGDTASATYRLAGAGNAAYAAFRLSSETGASIPVFQWTDTYALALAAPAFRLVNTEVGYTNLSFTATCFGLGLGATSAAVDLELATDDAFTTVVRTKRLALTTLGSEQVAFADLSTNTTYYARVVGTNDKNETGASSTVAKTTLNPGAAAGVCSYAGNGFSTLAATAVVTGFGDGSSVATVRLEASQNAGFGVLDAISSEVAATLNASTDLSCEGLAPASSYYLRLRIENEWGLVTYVPLAGTFTTRDIPILASGIGYSFGAGGSTVTITFGVDEVFDGATCTATLTYNGRGAGSKTFSTPGTLTWAGLAA